MTGTRRVLLLVMTIILRFSFRPADITEKPAEDYRAEAVM